MLETTEETKSTNPEEVHEIHTEPINDEHYHDDSQPEVKNKNISDFKNLNDLKDIANTQEFKDAKEKVNQQLELFELLFPTLRKWNDRSM